MERERINDGPVVDEMRRRADEGRSAQLQRGGGPDVRRQLPVVAPIDGPNRTSESIAHSVDAFIDAVALGFLNRFYATHLRSLSSTEFSALIRPILLFHSAIEQ
jgi:hypothetical protein